MTALLEIMARKLTGNYNRVGSAKFDATMLGDALRAVIDPETVPGEFRDDFLILVANAVGGSDTEWKISLTKKKRGRRSKEDFHIATNNDLEAAIFVKDLTEANLSDEVLRYIKNNVDFNSPDDMIIKRDLLSGAGLLESKAEKVCIRVCNLDRRRSGLAPLKPGEADDMLAAGRAAEEIIGAYRERSQKRRQP